LKFLSSGSRIQKIILHDGKIIFAEKFLRFWREKTARNGRKKEKVSKNSALRPASNLENFKGLGKANNQVDNRKLLG
jgi:hypothetical protein